VVAGIAAFPIIVRPRGSHAGVGLAKIDDREAMACYLDQRQEEEFFIARFVDYSGDDGLFRKYRVVFVDGEPYACHMAIADRWDIWYLNAKMSESADKRLEEETFMRTFDVGFAHRHHAALAGVAGRIGLDYFTVDCAETRSGSLLIFEAGQYRRGSQYGFHPRSFLTSRRQMRKIFDAFVAMLERRVRRGREQAA